MPLRRLFPLAVALTAALAAGAAAPTVAAQPTVSGVAVFRFAEPGQPVIAVDLWGTMRQTGRFYVPPETSLLDLITLAGGPVLQAESNELVRSTTVALSREGAGNRTVVFESPIEALTTGGVALPPLQDGDVVTVTTTVRQTFDWLDAFGLVGATASLALIILRISGQL